MKRVLTRKNARESTNEPMTGSSFWISEQTFGSVQSIRITCVQRAGTCFKTHKPHARPTHFVTRTCCSARDSLRGSFHTYPPGPRALGAAIGTAFEAVVPSLVAFGSAEL